MNIGLRWDETCVSEEVFLAKEGGGTLAQGLRLRNARSKILNSDQSQIKLMQGTLDLSE